MFASAGACHPTGATPQSPVVAPAHGPAPAPATSSTVAPTPAPTTAHLSLNAKSQTPTSTGTALGLTITVQEVREKYMNTGGTAMRVKLSLQTSDASTTVDIAGNEALEWNGYTITYDPKGWRDTVELGITGK